MKSALTIAIALVAACSSDAMKPSGNTPDASMNPGDPDAPSNPGDPDAPPGNVPAMITMTGATTEQGLSGTSNVGGATLGAYRITDENTPVATATSAADGSFTLTVATGGQPFDGFIKATKADYVDIYLYPEAAFTENFTNADINMLTPDNKNFLNTLAGGGQTAGKGMIGLAILDAQGNPVAGATVSSMPASGASRYTGSNGFPSSSETATSADGVAFLFNVPVGAVIVKATKAGVTFHPHQLWSRADKFTVTSISP